MQMARFDFAHRDGSCYVILTIKHGEAAPDKLSVILKGIKAEGKFIIYGIYFDFDKADVRSESEPTLREIAMVLRDDPPLNLYVVGHTDMKGMLNYNIDLSKRRAAAVVKELTTKHSIAAGRLTPDGVGPLAPVATNETEEGRAKNRRVELVAK